MTQSEGTTGPQTTAPQTTAQQKAAQQRAKGKDVDGLKTLPGVHSASGEEKAGTGEADEEGDDPASVHVAGAAYPTHPPLDGPPRRHR